MNSASFLQGRYAQQDSPAVTPGELITLFGSNIGPAEPVSGQPDSAGNFPRDLSGTRILLNGAPIPLLHADAHQINAFIPYDVRAPLKMSIGDGPSYSIEIAPVVSGLFQNGSDAAAINEDGTVNSMGNPAPRGSVISLFGTGFGQLSPVPTSDSAPVAAPFPMLVQHFEVRGYLLDSGSPNL